MNKCSHCKTEPIVQTEHIVYVFCPSCGKKGPSYPAKWENHGWLAYGAIDEAVFDWNRQNQDIPPPVD